MIFGELSLEEFKIQCPLNIIENPMYIKKSLEEAIKAKDENDFERLHTNVWLFKLYNINAYIALFLYSCNLLRLEVVKINIDKLRKE